MKYPKILKHIFFVIIFVLSTILSSCRINFEPGNKIHFKDYPIYNESNETIYLHYFGSANDNYLTVQMCLMNMFKLSTLEVYNNLSICLDDDKPLNLYYQLMIFKESTLEKYTKDELIENNIYDYKYVFTYDDLEELGFEIHFTGGDELDKYRR